MNLPDEDRAELLAYLEAQYVGIFPPGQLARHETDYIGLDIARQELELVSEILAPGSRILDVGCGFGAFVMAARQAGFDARGLDLAGFEIAFARKRLELEMPGADVEAIYQVGDGQDLPFPDGSFEGVTLWNVAEHVPDAERLVAECARLLVPGGALFVICPNYAAFREEAHYHVPWLPLLPRGLAARYLRWLGRDPRFFEADIHYRTNWGVLRTLRRHGLAPHDPLAEKFLVPEQIKSARIRAAALALRRLRLMGLARLGFGLRFHNPFKQAVWLYARKEGTL
jgi:SAM-dependent methyltransferase